MRYDGAMDFAIEKDILKSLRLPQLLEGSTPMEQKQNWENKSDWYKQQIQDTIYGEVPEERGVAVVNYDRTALRPNVDGKEGAIYRLFPEWDGGSLAAWSWGMMRCIDYLTTRSEIDESKIAVAGHSQAGKATMVTSVLDERVAMAISLCSGCTGTGLLNYYGYHCETPKDLTLRDRWHYWLKPKAHRYSRGREVLLPSDMHTIRAMMAPRLVLSIDGVVDHWANPAGTKLGHIASQEIYALYDMEDRNRALFREGGHGVGDVDLVFIRDFMIEHGFIE